MKYAYFFKGIGELIASPRKIANQPWILAERLLYGLEKTIGYHTYKKNGDNIYIELGGMKFAIGSNIHVFTEIMNEIYPFLTDRVIESIIPENSYFDVPGGVVLNKGDYVIDAGASLGFFSIAAAHRVGPAGRVIAFEPFEMPRKLLMDSAKENGLKNLEIHDCAVGSKNEVLDYEVDTGGYGTGSRLTDGNKRGSNTFRVSVRTIDSMVKKLGLKKLDFIKMDIEGHERHALMGARDTMKKFRPKLSLCTYHLPDDPQVIREMILSINPQYRIIEKSHKILAG